MKIARGKSESFNPFSIRIDVESREDLNDLVWIFNKAFDAAAKPGDLLAATKIKRICTEVNSVFYGQTLSSEIK